jgi:hypothetical protein
MFFQLSIRSNGFMIASSFFHFSAPTSSRLPPVARDTAYLGNNLINPSFLKD